MLELTGTITNTTGQAIFLNGGTGNITGSDITALTFDDSDFLNNLPLSLDINPSYAGQIAVQVSPTATNGVYLFNYAISATGATDGTNYTGSDTALITVTAGVPEAPSGILAALLLGAGSLILRRQRQARQ